jgi:hypothetical protein
VHLQHNAFQVHPVQVDKDGVSSCAGCQRAGADVAPLPLSCVGVTGRFMAAWRGWRALGPGSPFALAPSTKLARAVTLGLAPGWNYASQRSNLKVGPTFFRSWRLERSGLAPESEPDPTLAARLYRVLCRKHSASSHACERARDPCNVIRRYSNRIFREVYHRSPSRPG